MHHEICWADWLDEERVGSCRQRALPVECLALGGDHDHRSSLRFVMSAERFDEGVAVHHGHVDVDDAGKHRVFTEIDLGVEAVRGLDGAD